MRRTFNWIADNVGTLIVATVIAVGGALFLFSIVLVLIGQFSSKARAHPIDGKKNTAGEWCCGEGDCFVVESDKVKLTAHSYVIDRSAGSGKNEFEVIPYTEALPSPDGQFWRCHRFDGSRRCFFAPPPSI